MAEEQDVAPVPQTESNEKKEEEVEDSESGESEGEEEEESADEDLFEVEKIISRKKRNGVTLYRVRWKGYPPSNDTWEPLENLDIVADMVRDFDKLQDQKAKSRQEERRLRKLRMEGKKLPGEESSDDDSDSNKEESQLCETTKFFKRLEKDKDLVWSQPDLYSKVKSRAASLSSKKQDQQVEEVTSPRAPQAQTESSRGRGRGRPRGGGTPRKKGTGRGRGRPPKKTTGKSSDEEDEDDDSVFQSKKPGKGRGRRQKKSEKDSLSDSLSDGSDSLSDSSRSGEQKPGAKGDGDKKKDSDDSAPLAEQNAVKKPTRDSSEEKKDSEKPSSAVKTAGKPRGRPPKKAKESTEKKGDSEKSADLGKKSGKGRGRPPKSMAIRDTSEESDADPVKTKGKDRPKKSVEESSEDHGGLGNSAVSVKTKGRGRGRPPKKSIRDTSDENDNSDDSAPLVKSSQAAPKESLADRNSEDKEASDLSPPPEKKKGKVKGKPRKKNVIIDTSGDSESDAAATLAKTNIAVQDRSRMSVITDQAGENNSGDSVTSARKLENEGKQSGKVCNKEENSAREGKQKDASKTKNKVKSRKKMIIDDSEDSADDTVPLKDPSPPSQTSEKKKKKERKDKKDVKGQKQDGSSKERPPKTKKVSSKSEKRSLSTTDSTTEQTVASAPASHDCETKAAVDSKKTDSSVAMDIKKTESPVAVDAKRAECPIQSGPERLPRSAGSKPKPRAVIPVLEKLAMAVMNDELTLGTDSLYSVSEDKVCKDGKAASSASGTKEDRPGPKGSQKKSNSKESKEDAASQKKNLSKGSKGSTTKRKLDTATEHVKAVKEGGASPSKVASPKPASCELSTPVKNPAPKASRILVESLGTGSAASPVLPSSPMDTGANSSDSPATSSASNKQEVAAPDPVVEDLKPVSSPAPQKPRAEAKVKSSKSKEKTQSTKSHKSSPKSKPPSTKAEKLKSEKDGKSVEKSVKIATHSSVQLQSTASDLPTSVPVASSVSDVTKVTAQNDDPSAKPALAGNEFESTIKSDFSAKCGRLDSSESKPIKIDPDTCGIVRTQTAEKTVAVDQTELKCPKVEGDESKRKHSVTSELTSPLTADSGRLSLMRTSSTSELCSPLSSGTEKPFIFRSGSTSELSSSLSSSLARQSMFSMSASSPGRSTPIQGRDSALSAPGKDLLTMSSSPGANRDLLSPYSYNRDFTVLGRTSSWGAGSPRDTSQTAASPKDSPLGSSKDFPPSALTRDFLAASILSRDPSPASLSSRESPFAMGFASMSSAVGRESSLYPSSSRILSYSQNSWTPSRQDFNANIASKDSSDKLFTSKSLYKSPAPSPTEAREGDRSKGARGIDQELGDALQTIDLEYVEKLSLAPVTPMELSHDELRQAVIDGNCYLVERALKCSKRYNFDLPDNKGYTLLMNAVLKGCDDIIVHLLTQGASAEAQVKGNTALMLAVEYAECSTVYMLLEMGACVNTADNSGETALFKAVRRGDKQILKLVLDHGADFNWTSQARLTALQTAKQYRLADIDVTLTDHIHRVVETFEEEVRRVMGGAARLVSCLFPHRCVPVRDTDSLTVSFEYRPTLPSGPSMGCLLFIAHARFDPEVRCRLYGECAVQKVMLNRVEQLCITEESNFVMVCHPLITGWNELLITTQKDPMSRAKLLVCAYKTELIR